MGKTFSEHFSMKGWRLWEFIKGRKKLMITIIGCICAQFAFDVQLTGLLAGGAVFEGVWAVLEYYFKRIEIK